MIEKTTTLLLHALQELQEHLGARAHQHLTLTALLSVGNGLEGVSENVHQHGEMGVWEGNEWRRGIAIEE